MFSSKWKVAFAVLACLVALPSLAHAQSAIAGIVRDTSGAVLPGVTVEAASPALIEKTRAVTTDGEGRYNIVDLRPGCLHRHVLAARVQHRQARRRRTAQQLHGHDQRRPEGRRARGDDHGLRPVAGRRHLDRRAAAGAEPRGARRGADRPQHSHAGRAASGRAPGAARRRRHVRHAEPRPHRARIGRPRHHLPGRRHDAERHRGRRQRAELLQRGDVRGNQLSDQRHQRRDVGRRRPRQHDSQGRRQRSSRARCSSPARNKRLQSDNSADAKAQGPGGARRLNKVWDFNVAEGGPIKKDKLWFFASYRDWGVYQYIANSFFRNGDQTIDDASIRSGVVRLTTQLGDEAQGGGVSRSHPQVPRPRELRAGRLRDRRRGDRHPRAEAVLHDRDQVDRHGHAASCSSRRGFAINNESYTLAGPRAQRQASASTNSLVIPRRDTILQTAYGAVRRRHLLPRADPQDLRRRRRRT